MLIMRWLVIAVLFCSLAQGAQVYGSVYTFSLDKALGSVVKINSSPEQRIVAQNGEYEFSVESGEYVLSASKGDEFIEEVILIENGRFVRDLILIPDFDADLLIDDEEIPSLNETVDIIEPRPAYQWVLWIVLFVGLGYIVWKLSQKPNVVEKRVKEIREVVISDDLERLVKFVERHNGRVLQKDIRKEFAYSEAKISLMLDELEGKGVIKRIKKGRGNIIIKA